MNQQHTNIQKIKNLPWFIRSRCLVPIEIPIANRSNCSPSSSVSRQRELVTLEVRSPLSKSTLISRRHMSNIISNIKRVKDPPRYDKHHTCLRVDLESIYRLNFIDLSWTTLFENFWFLFYMTSNSNKIRITKQQIYNR